VSSYFWVSFCDPFLYNKRQKERKKMDTFFTSDTHFGHANIIKHCHRPFNTAEEMDAALIERWNSVVAPTDVVYHLGDVAFRGTKGNFISIFSRLNGIIHLIRGNHDNEEVLTQAWASISDYLEIRAGSKKIVLCHYPMRSWNGMYNGSLHLYGHEHGNIPDHGNCLDVGVDKWNFYPVTLTQIQYRMASLTPWAAKASKEPSF